MAASEISVKTRFSISCTNNSGFSIVVVATGETSREARTDHAANEKV